MQVLLQRSTQGGPCRLDERRPVVDLNKSEMSIRAGPPARRATGALEASDLGGRPSIPYVLTARA